MGYRSDLSLSLKNNVYYLRFIGHTLSIFRGHMPIESNTYLVLKSHRLLSVCLSLLAVHCCEGEVFGLVGRF